MNMDVLHGGWLPLRMIRITLVTLSLLTNLAQSSIICGPDSINAAREPRRPPRTVIGSFEYITSPVDESIKDVFIYWQNIDESEKCGELFEYRVSINPTKMYNKNVTINRNYDTYANHAKFVGLNSSIGYNFKVHSANIKGLSTDYASIYVPRESDQLEKSLVLTKKELDERGVYVLSWQNSSLRKTSDTNEIDYYTLFWCENDSNHPYQCNGHMNWTHVPVSVSSHIISVENPMKTYQFAISANRQILQRNYFNNIFHFTSNSSGLIWEACTAIRSKSIGKVKNFWVSDIGSTYMGLTLKLDCTDTIGIVQGLTIFYCPATTTSSYDCKDRMSSKTIYEEMRRRNSFSVYLMGLRPSTPYIVIISAITRYGKGLRTYPLLKTTLEQ